MSKDAANRAMREARYAETRARSAGAAPTRAAGAKPPVAPPRKQSTPPPADDPAPAAAAADGLCGHRSMNGRTCTREHGHAAKSHRYS